METLTRPSVSRAMWSGAITFGMVSAPVKLYSATEDATPKLHMVCRQHTSGIRFRRWCTDGDHEVEQHDLGKGLQSGDTWHLVDVKRDEPMPKELRVSEFVPAEAVSVTYYQRPYYVAPDKSGRRPYDLLVAALERTGTVGIVRFAVRDKQQLAILRAEAGRLVLTVLYWPEELRTTEALPNLSGESQTSEAEVKLAERLVRSMKSKRFDEAAYHSESAARVREAVDSAVPMPVAGKPVPVVDLMGALKASIDAAGSREQEVA